jgi:hypothetical protein
MTSNNRAFLQSSAIMLVSNILVAGMNYSVVIFASRFLLSEYSTWTSLTSFLAIASAFSGAISTNMTRNVSKMVVTSLANSRAYLNKYINLLVSSFIWLFLLLPIVSGIVWLLLGRINYFIIFILIAYLVINLYISLQQSFLLGILDIKDYTITTIVLAFIKFSVSLFCLYLGLQLWALPIGLIVSTVLAIFITKYFVSNYFNQNPISKVELETALKSRLDLKGEFQSMLYTLISLFLLTTLMNIGPILIQNSSISLENKDILAVLFNFGQIIHFGAIAGLGSLIAYASRSSDKKIYFASISFVTLITLGIGMLFALFGPFLLNIIGRSQYQWAISLTIIYAIFIAFYNIIFATVQYLIAHHSYKPILWLLSGIIIPSSFLFIRDWSFLSSIFDLVSNFSPPLYKNQISVILPFILLSIFGSAFTCIPLVFSVKRLKI